MERVTGTVLWFNDAKGYGFIRPDDGGPRCFVHFAAIHGWGHRALVQGEAVEFSVQDNPRHGPRAVHVRRLATA